VQGVYSAFLDALRHLDDPTKSAFQCAHALLQNIATIGLCVPMLDLECDGADGLVVELFQVLFETICPMNCSLVEEDVTKVLSTMLEEAEEVPPEVLHTILERLIQPCKGENAAAHNLACNLICKSENNLQISVQHFLTDALANRGTGEHPLCKRYADILEEVAITDSTSLVTVWPIIMDELQNDDAEARVRAVKLFGRILAAPGGTVARDFSHYLQQFLRRFTDKKTEIRVEMAKWGSTFLLGVSDEDAAVAKEVVDHFDARLLDFEEKVRLATVHAVCDVAEASPRLVPVETLERVGARMLDKKGGVRQLVLKRLASVYRTYVTRYADVDPPESEAERFDWIPAHLVKGCAHPDIRHHVVEPVLGELFPQKLSTERRSFFWLRALSKQDEHAPNALAYMLRAKLHVQNDMREYLTLRQKLRASQQSQSQSPADAGESPQEDVSDVELSRRFAAVGQNFPDAGKAAACMEKIHAMKDGNIFRGLSSLLKAETSAAESHTIAEDILKRIGSKHPAYEWARLLLVKITQQPFGREHVCRVLDIVASPVAANDDVASSLVASALEHLVQLAHSAPQTFQGTAKELSGLISHREEAIVTAACKITADAASCLDVTGAHQAKICARLKLLCVEGTRTQAKHAATTLAKLAATASVGQEHLRDVFEGIMDAAGDDELLDSNLPGVLSTIQIVGQQATGLFMEHLEGIEAFIVEDLLQRALPKSRGRPRSISTVAELQAWGLKALAKGCGRAAASSRAAAPAGEMRASFVQRVLGVLRGVLSPPDEEASARLASGVDLTHLRVAAGKAVLVIARTDHAAVTPDLFISTSLLISDAPGEMISKLHHGIIKHGLAQGYAAPLALVSACTRDAETRTAARDALGSIVVHVRRRAANVKATAVKNAAASVDSAALSRTLLIHTAEYVLPYLIFLLAHHPDLPSKDAGAEDGGSAYRPFEQAIHFAIAALTAGTTGECLPAACKMMRKLKSAVDAVDADMSHGIYVLSDIALLILHQASTQKRWVTGPYPGQVGLPKAFYTLLQRPAVGDPMEEGGNVRVGDFSHLPVGFALKPKKREREQAAAAPKRNRGGASAAAGGRSKPAVARGAKKSTAIRSGKPAVAPSRTLPSRAARKAAIVDGMDEEGYSEEDSEEDTLGDEEEEDEGGTHLAGYGMRAAPPLELPAPAGWDSDADADADADEDEDNEDNEDEDEDDMDEDEDEDDMDEDEEGDAAVDSPPLVNNGGRKKMPLADRKNAPAPRETNGGGGAKLASPALLLNEKQKENDDSGDAFSPERLTEEIRVSKQRRR
jgi:sister-chromatid-cohesion protein PDS5